MALADAHTTRYAPVLDLGPGDRRPCAPERHCDTAIEALERALNAIACDDIEARCDAVGTATEATTALFLELDRDNHGVPAQDAGRIYETILMRLVGINLLNDPATARETITMIEGLRDACTRAGSGEWRPCVAAAQRIDP